MVKGREPERLAVIDLDGTLLAGNSLHEYIRCALAEHFLSGQFAKAASILALSSLRALRIITHRTYKFRVLGQIHPTPSLKQRFTRKIDKLKREDVKLLINDFHSDNIKVILATAAPDVYVPWIWPGQYIATPLKDNPHNLELRGTRKRDAVMKFAEKNNLILHAVVTDHSDDLPLLKAGASRNYLIKPSSHTLMTVKMAGVSPLTVL